MRFGPGAALVTGLHFALKWRWLSENPARLATVPRNTAELTDPPSPEEAARLMEAAHGHSPDLALFIWLVLVTGARRGEICALRWTDLDAAEQDPLIERSYAVQGGRKVIKDTKTHQKRRLAIDADTLEMLTAHHDYCRKRTEQAGGCWKRTATCSPGTGSGSCPGCPTRWAIGSTKSLRPPA